MNLRKRVLIYTMISSQLFVLFSCTNLDETVYSQLRADHFFNTQQDVVRAMAPIYADFRKLLAHQSWWDIVETTDVAVTPVRGSAWYDGGIYIRLHEHSWKPSDAHFNTNSSIWNKLYGNINTCNRVLYLINNSKFEVDNKESYIAEVRTARAYIYYMLCSLFGNIPIVKKYDVPLGYLPPTEPRTKVVNFISNELKQSIPHLSTTAGGEMYGRFNRWAALSILARLYINSEAWIGVPQWDSCIITCNKIIDSKKYQLAEDFRDNFALDNNKSPELIFSWPFDEQYSGNTIYIAYQKTLSAENLRKTYNAQVGAHDGVQAVPSFIDTFNPDDKRLDYTFAIGQQYSMDGIPLKNYGVVPRDKGTPLVYTNTLSDIRDAGESEGYRFNKFEIKIGTKRTPDNDWPAIRYAEILYMKAECLLRTNQPGASDLVNQVRKRAFDTPTPITDQELAATINVNNMPVKYGLMLEEWGWEFAEETLRREQLIRFDNNYIMGTWTAKTKTGEDYRKLFPIPLTALASNKNLKQNPGY